MSKSSLAGPGNGAPVGGGEYEVREGECVESIATRHGHHWKTIWYHPDNADLRAARASPNILLPGDRLHIPPREIAEYVRPTDMCHRFTLLGRPVKLRLRMLEGGRPRANEVYRLRIDHQLFSGKTDGDGNIEIAIPPEAAAGELIVGSGRTRQRVYALQLGGMEPIDTPLGLQKRLRNLGYECPLTGEMDAPTTEAIAFFQNDYGLETTGLLTDETRQKLLDSHAS